MKFAKELDQDLVPEWRAKYFDYKTGKKKVKAVARALKDVNQTPKTPGRQLPSNLLNNTFQSPIRNHVSLHTSSAQSTPEHRVSGLTSYGSAKPTLQGGRSSRFDLPSPGDSSAIGSSVQDEGSSPRAIPGQGSTMETLNESDSLWDSASVTNYGSFIASPPSRIPPMGPPSLELPDPALSPNEEQFPRHNRAWRHSRFNPNPHTTPPTNKPNPKLGDAYEVGKTHTPLMSSQLLPKHRNLFRPRRTISTPGGGSAPARPSRLRRIFSTAGLESPQSGDVPLEAYKEYDVRQADYFTFLDKELDKIETFYKMKEAQAGERLQLLRQQLHEMRDRRLEELRAERIARERARAEHARIESSDGPHERDGGHNRSVSSGLRWMQPIESAIGSRKTRIGKVTKSLQQWGSPMGPQGQQSSGVNRPESWRDFSRRPTYPDDVPYRSAKRKLKLALQEFYRGLELLKSYALLNRTAFRKINKKYDKAVKARPVGRYMSEKVNKAWFVQSEVLDGQIVAVEDLYARYFEGGNHKVAAGKLRSKTAKPSDFSGSIFRNGLLLAGGLVFGIEGLVYGAERLLDPDLGIRTDASYLLQFRLLLAGLYPVEFRDFFLGDMYCSQTYAMGNIELFFCLYARGWNNPTQCNSTHSRLLGFLSTVPGLWRAFQCLRRYYDTRNAFPHLVNCGKYTFTILFYMTLSLYRVREHYALKALFITCATINSVYCSIWDLAMDWSLCNPYAEHRFLRDVLGYKRPWVYYLAMVLDPILRFNWIFYAIYASELQHSALLSFFVGFSEVCRRGMWTLFRVENEHCTNVGRFRASRDVPLPYEIEPPTPPSAEDTTPESHPPTQTDHVRRASLLHDADSPLDITAASSTLEAQPSSGSLRRRTSHTLSSTPIQRGIARVGTIMQQAHAQDFERKRRPVAPEPASPYHGAITAEESSDEEDEEAEAGEGEEGDTAAGVRRENEEDVRGAQDIMRRQRSPRPDQSWD
ncbi:Xenotropic and polytropic retrovirus receptor 1 [Lecanora helva]